MPDLPAPVAARLPRARWLEPRALVGLLLVLGSVVLGTRVVAAADDRVSVWSARHALSAGAVLGAEDVMPVRVRLDAAQDRYLAASAPVAGLVVTRAMGAGELVATGAVGQRPAVDVRDVTVSVTGSIAGLGRHAVVDVYVLPKASGDAAAARQASAASLQPVLRRVPVLRIGADGAFGSGSTTSVTLQVPAPEVGGVLSALAGGEAQLVEVPA